MLFRSQITGVDLSRLPQGMTQDGGFTVVDHHVLGNALEKGESVLVATQEMLLALAQGELDIQKAAVAEHGGKEGQAATSRAHLDKSPTTPVHLHAFPWQEVERQEGFGVFGSDQAHILQHDTVADGQAFLVNPTFYTGAFFFWRPEDFLGFFEIYRQRSSLHFLNSDVS